MSLTDDLAKLEEMRDRGTLTQAEFEQAKAKLLNPSPLEPALSGINNFRRSRDDRWAGGVCGGLAVSTGLAAWIWRTLFALLTLAGGSGVLIYLVLWIFVPEKV